MLTSRVVCPEDLSFTQDTIPVTFRKPREKERIDDAVNLILQARLSPKAFPQLNVVEFQNRLWSLDNRRLWVFKKAGVNRITVTIVGYDFHDRFSTLVSTSPYLYRSMSRKDFFPRLRGHCKERFTADLEPPSPSLKFPPGNAESHEEPRGKSKVQFANNDKSKVQFVNLEPPAGAGEAFRPSSSIIKEHSLPRIPSKPQHRDWDVPLRTELESPPHDERDSDLPSKKRSRYGSPPWPLDEDRNFAIPSAMQSNLNSDSPPPSTDHGSYLDHCLKKRRQESMPWTGEEHGFQDSPQPAKKAKASVPVTIFLSSDSESLPSEAEGPAENKQPLERARPAPPARRNKATSNPKSFSYGFHFTKRRAKRPAPKKTSAAARTAAAATTKASSASIEENSVNSLSESPHLQSPSRVARRKSSESTPENSFSFELPDPPPRPPPVSRPEHSAAKDGFKPQSRAASSGAGKKKPGEQTAGYAHFVPMCQDPPTSAFTKSQAPLLSSRTHSWSPAHLQKGTFDIEKKKQRTEHSGAGVRTCSLCPETPTRAFGVTPSNKARSTCSTWNHTLPRGSGEDFRNLADREKRASNLENRHHGGRTAGGNSSTWNQTSPQASSENFWNLADREKGAFNLEKKPHGERTAGKYQFVPLCPDPPSGICISTPPKTRSVCKQASLQPSRQDFWSRADREKGAPNAGTTKAGEVTGKGDHVNSLLPDPFLSTPPKAPPTSSQRSLQPSRRDFWSRGPAQCHRVKGNPVTDMKKPEEQIDGDYHFEPMCPNPPTRASPGKSPIKACSACNCKRVSPQPSREEFWKPAGREKRTVQSNTFATRLNPHPELQKLKQRGALAPQKVLQKPKKQGGLAPHKVLQKSKKQGGLAPQKGLQKPKQRGGPAPQKELQKPKQRRGFTLQDVQKSKQGRGFALREGLPKPKQQRGLAPQKELHKSKQQGGGAPRKELHKSKQLSRPAAAHELWSTGAKGMDSRYRPAPKNMPRKGTSLQVKSPFCPKSSCDILPTKKALTYAGQQRQGDPESIVECPVDYDSEGQRLEATRGLRPLHTASSGGKFRPEKCVQSAVTVTVTAGNDCFGQKQSQGYTLKGRTEKLKTVSASTKSKANHQTQIIPHPSSHAHQTMLSCKLLRSGGFTLARQRTIDALEEMLNQIKREAQRGSEGRGPEFPTGVSISDPAAARRALGNPPAIMENSPRSGTESHKGCGSRSGKELQIVERPRTRGSETSKQRKTRSSLYKEKGANTSRPVRKLIASTDFPRRWENLGYGVKSVKAGDIVYVNISGDVGRRAVEGVGENKISARSVVMGPFEVMKKVNGYAARLLLPPDCIMKNAIVRLAMLTKRVGPLNTLVPHSGQLVPEAILMKRMVQRSRRRTVYDFMVQWKNLPVHQATWESEIILDEHPHLLNQADPPLFPNPYLIRNLRT